MGQVIYNAEDLSTAAEEILQHVDRAIVAAAYRITENARDQFIRGGNQYKNHTSRYDALAEGIMIGRLQKDHTVAIHALGKNGQGNSWKARFFVGGTVPRKNSRGYKGYIKATNSVDDAMNGAQNILNTYINSALNG